MPLHPKQPLPQQQCADKLKILGDTTRLSVIGLLMEGPKGVAEMNAVLGLDQSLLSHHLKILRDAGLVASTREGKGMRYALAEGIDLSRTGKMINLGCCKLKFD
ncbi:MAG: ArsR/SmtB family transcription factor [Nitrospiria bacterium]